MRYCNVLALAFIVLFGIKADAKVPPECLCSLHGIRGGTMYTSCDEAHITFSGSCTYSLMKTCNDTSDDMIYKPPFKVEVKNDYKTENDNQNTFVREISVSFRDNSITFDSKGGFMVNNNQAATNYIGDGFTVTRLELAEFDVIELNTDFSLKILIHTNSPTHRIRVKVGRRYHKKLCGLCGNYDGKSGNDFQVHGDLLDNTYRQGASNEMAKGNVVQDHHSTEPCEPVVNMPHPNQVLERMMDTEKVKALYGDCSDEDHKEEGISRCDVSDPNHPTKGSFTSCIKSLENSYFLEPILEGFISGCTAAYCFGKSERAENRNACYYMKALSDACDEHGQKVSGWCKAMECPARGGCEKWEPKYL